MSLMRSDDASVPSLGWLIVAVTRGHSDADVSALLDRAAEERARAVLPATFFGWLAAEAEATVAIVSEANDADSRVPYAEVARASARALTDLAYRLARGEPHRRFLDHPLRFAAPAARLGIASSVVVDSMRIVERRWVGQLLAAAEDRAGEVAPVVLRTSAAVYDTLVDGFVVDYIVAQSRLDHEASALKRTLVDALLQADASDAGVFEDLDVDPSAHHVGVVLWRPAGIAGAHLDAAAGSIAERAIGASVLVVPGDDHQVWIWLSFADDPSHAELERIRSIPRDTSRVGLALGPAATGARGFRMTHMAARDYADVATHLPRAAAPAIADADSVAYLSLLLRDRERAEWFVATELGTIGTGSSASDREARETLRIYLATGQSLADTAQHLRIHRNTVVYRLKRIELAIGRTISSRRHELHAAALIAHLLDQTT